MQNNPIKNKILSELPNGNQELGEAFCLIINDMVTITGNINPDAQTFDLMPASWKKLASKTDKTQDDIKKLDNYFKQAVYEIAESYLLYIAQKTQNLDGKITYEQYEKFMISTRFGAFGLITGMPDFAGKVKIWLKNAFKKISSHGEPKGDNLIDKHDMASYVYALALISRHDANNEFEGFDVNGDISPSEYAVNERLLFEEEDNMMSLKMRVGYKFLNGEI